MIYSKQFESWQFFLSTMNIFQFLSVSNLIFAMNFNKYLIGGIKEDREKCLDSKFYHFFIFRSHFLQTCRNSFLAFLENMIENWKMKTAIKFSKQKSCLSFSKWTNWLVINHNLSLKSVNLIVWMSINVAQSSSSPNLFTMHEQPCALESSKLGNAGHKAWVTQH